MYLPNPIKRSYGLDANTLQTVLPIELSEFPGYLQWITNESYQKLVRGPRSQPGSTERNSRSARDSTGQPRLQKHHNCRSGLRKLHNCGIKRCVPTPDPGSDVMRLPAWKLFATKALRPDEVSKMLPLDRLFASLSFPLIAGFPAKLTNIRANPAGSFCGGSYYEMEPGGFGKCTEITVARKKRNPLINTALRNQCVAEAAFAVFREYFRS